MIISPGIGSGLDIEGLVTQLVAAEGAPASFRLDKKEAIAQAELSAFGSLKSALSAFRDALEPLSELSEFQGRVTSSSDELLLTASADADSVQGRYNIEVSQLAQAQKLSSQFYSGPEAAVGHGTLTISVGTDAFNVVINSEANTLADIRDAINDSNDNTGVRATIVNSTDGSHLVLSSVETGEANALTITATGGDGGLDDITYDVGGGVKNLTELEAALDAEILIDSLSVKSSTNTISDAIDGITLKLHAAAPGLTTELTVDYDDSGATDAVNAFIDAYNDLVGKFAEFSSYDAETGNSGPLFGDSTLRFVSSELRREMGVGTKDLNEPLSSLLDIGITTKLDGTLEVDTEKLNAQLEGSFDDIGKLFSSDEGYAARLDAILGRYLDAGGQLEARTDGLQETIDDIGGQRESLSERLAAVETRLRAQFNALDSLVSQLSSTSAFLAQQLVNLPGATFRS